MKWPLFDHSTKQQFYVIQPDIASILSYGISPLRNCVQGFGSLSGEVQRI